MKKYFGLMLLTSLIIIPGLLFGCAEVVDTSTTTTTTTTTTTSTLPHVAAPTFGLSAGTYEANSVTITLECSTSGADIYYTTDGTTPSASSTAYTASFSLEASRTIKAIATKTGSSDSTVASAIYNLYWWQAYGAGLPAEVYSLATGSLYVGGIFTSPPYLAQWTGTIWEAIGPGADAHVATLINDSTNNLLYAGGYFTSPVAGIMKWNGSAWSALGTGGPDQKVDTLALTSSGQLYAGGLFTTNFSRIAFWDGASWSSLEAGVDNSGVYCLAYDDANDYLYVGGDFTTVSAHAIPKLARWNVGSATWEAPFVTQPNNAVFSIKFDPDNNDLYIGGDFSNLGEKIAKWDADGSSWSAMDTGFNVRAMAIAIGPDGTIYAGGTFYKSGDLAKDLYYIAVWDGSEWSSFHGGLNDAVIKITFDANGDMIVVGEFTATQDGSVSANRVIKWGRKN